VGRESKNTRTKKDASQGRSKEPRPNVSLSNLGKRTFGDTVKEFLDAAKKAGLNVAVFEAERSAERQRWLHAQRLSKPDGVKERSSHQFGTAVDIVFKDQKNEFSFSADHDWKKLGELGESFGLVWGGRWKPPVVSHFQQDPFQIFLVDLHHNRFDAVASCGGCSQCSS